MSSSGRSLARSCSGEQIRSIAGKCNGLHMTIIEIRPFRKGWQVFDSAGVQPVFLSQEQAIDYAKARVCFRSGKIRILDSNGTVERVIPFNEADRNL